MVATVTKEMFDKIERIVMDQFNKGQDLGMMDVILNTKKDYDMEKRFANGDLTLDSKIAIYVNDEDVDAFTQCQYVLMEAACVWIKW